MAINIVKPNWILKVLESYEGYPLFSKVIATKVIDELAYPDYNLNQGVLRYKGAVCVGQSTEMGKNILETMHTSSYGGHSGILGTYMRIKAIFYWPKLKEDMTLMVKECDTCSQAKGEHGPYPGMLQPLEIPKQAWTHISMDFIEGLPKSEGKTVILVAVDRFSKYGHFIGLSHPYIAITIARAFLDNFYKLHG